MERSRLRSPFLPPVLISESADKQAEICRALEQEIKPIGVIEKMYVADIASIAFEILRLRRCKTGIINSSFRAALQSLLTQLLREPGQLDDYEPEEVEALALAWFSDQKAREQVSQTLSRFRLDESAIEAEAIRRSSSDLERIEGLLASLELRRARALCCVAEYRAGLAHQLQESANRIIEAKNVHRLEHAGKKSAAA
jgi:hypothetical protein